MSPVAAPIRLGPWNPPSALLRFSPAGSTGIAPAWLRWIARPSTFPGTAAPNSSPGLPSANSRDRRWRPPDFPTIGGPFRAPAEDRRRTGPAPGYAWDHGGAVVSNRRASKGRLARESPVRNSPEWVTPSGAGAPAGRISAP